MGKYLLLFLLATACTQSNTKKIVNDVTVGLNQSSDYHSYVDEVISPAAKRLIQAYEKDPQDVCETLNTTTTEELLNLYDVLQEVNSKITLYQ